MNLKAIPAKHIAVLFDPISFSRKVHIVNYLADFWRADGHAVTYLKGTRRYVPADLVLLHVDLSVVPDNYAEFARRYPIALNARIRDIRKSTISENLVRPGDGWNGPVVVKTDLNYGGLPEQKVLKNRLKRLAQKGSAWLLGKESSIRDRRPLVDYGIYPSISDVPANEIGDSRLIVERFLPEKDGDEFVLRTILMFGSKYESLRLRSANPVIKAHRSSHSEKVEPHPKVFEWREKFGLDYGKIDYVIHEGRPVLLDINKTIGATNTYRPSDVIMASRRNLANGLYDYFD